MLHCREGGGREGKLDAGVYLASNKSRVIAMATLAGKAFHSAIVRGKEDTHGERSTPTGERRTPTGEIRTPTGERRTPRRKGHPGGKKDTHGESRTPTGEEGHPRGKEDTHSNHNGI